MNAEHPNDGDNDIVTHAKAFGNAFQGTSHHAFEHYLDDLLPMKYYTREIPVLQSSGSGKTRTITKTLERNIGVLFNVRRSSCTSFNQSVAQSEILISP